MDKLRSLNKYLIILMSVALVGFQLYTAAYMPFTAIVQRAVHLGLGLSLVFLVYPKKRSENKRVEAASYIIGFVLTVLALLTCGYIVVNWFALAKPMRLTMPKTIDKVYGTILIVLVLFGTRRITGWTMPIIAAIFLAYALLGKYIPIPLLRHTGVKFKQMVSMGYMTTEGVFSSVLGVSTTQVFIFLLFGQLLETLGGSEFFLDLANSGFGKVRGGPAKVAIFGSALFGSISGSAVANVVGTGTITIPLMKKVGYESKVAGAVESVASTGGLIMPPVMGAAAFVMAEILGIAYWQVCMAALIPAVLYYVGLYIAVDLRARAQRLKGLPENEIPNGREVLKRGGYIYLPPLIVLVIILGVFQFSAAKSCLCCCALLLALAMTKKDLRQKLKTDWLNIIVKTAKSSLTVIMACACAGLVLLGLQSSGLILKLSNILVTLSSGKLWLLLILVMIGSLIMGMGLPASACYILLAILAAPSIVQLGVPAMAAHLFVLYFGAMSAITPPVAMAAFAAAPIADEKATKIGFTAFRMALPAFLIAFCMCLQPELVMIGNWYDIILVTAFCILGVFCMAVGLQGYMLHEVIIWRRVLWCAAGVLLILPELYTSLPGLALAVILVITEKDVLPTIRNRFNKGSQPVSAA